jgi:hypothetical protein
MGALRETFFAKGFVVDTFRFLTAGDSDVRDWLILENVESIPRGLFVSSCANETTAIKAATNVNVNLFIRFLF